MKNLKEKAVSMLKQYYEATEKVECTDGIEAAFMQFLGYDPNENDFLYELACNRALIALTNPEISTALSESMGKRAYKNLVDILDRLQDFAHDLQQDHYRAYTQAIQIDIYGMSDCENEEVANKRLQYIIEETEKNMAALRARHPEEKL
jgi:hypothetical protein